MEGLNKSVCSVLLRILLLCFQWVLLEFCHDPSAQGGFGFSMAEAQQLFPQHSPVLSSGCTVAESLACSQGL